MRLFLLLILLLIFTGCGGDTPHPIPDPVIPTLEADYKQLATEIRGVQQKVRTLLGKLVDEIQHDNIDPKATSVEVRGTIKDVKALKEKLRKLPSSPVTKGPLT
jgi:hypothetical protein